MPRDSQGLYTLPPGNPVTPGTLIESAWANTTMPDLGNAITGSLPRDGSAPMTGNLTLANSNPTNSRHAASKGYVDSFLAYASGLPISACIPIAAAVVPAGWLLCNGQAVSRATYTDLFAAIGTTYNAGNTDPLTFKVPDLQNRVVKGKGGSRALGSTEAAAVGGHTHGVSDAGHSHGVTDGGHAHPVTTVAHTHAASQVAHAHSYTAPKAGLMTAGGVNTADLLGAQNTGTAQPAITVASASPTGTAANSTTGVTVNTGTTGISINDNAAGVENVVANMALDYYIKATQDSSSPAYINSLASDDVAVISIDLTTDPTEPMLLIHSNRANGLVKLDAGNKIPSNLIPFSGMNYQGPWDASTGNTPSQAYPSATFYDGDTFQIAVAGTLTVYDYTGTLAPRSCPIGSSLVYATDGTVFPVPGWYQNPAPTLAGATAAQIAFQPVGGISATDVQAACAELDTEKATVVYVDGQDAALQTAINGKTTTTYVDAAVAPKADTTYVDNADAALQVQIDAISGITLEPSVLATGTFKDFAIPAGAKRVTLMLDGVSVSATANIDVQVGTGSTPDTTGYTSSYGALTGANTNSTVSVTTAFRLLNNAGAAAVITTTLTLNLMDAAINKWLASGNGNRSDVAYNILTSGAKVLTGQLGVIRVLASTGNFDAGSISVSYE
jgi:microcystin-dependent protein